MYMQTIQQFYRLEYWEDFKIDITKHSINFAKQLNIERRHKIDTLQTQLDSLIGQKGTQDKINKLEAKLFALHADKFKGALIRSRINTIGSEEPSHYNIILEQIHAHTKQIKNITKDDGTEATDLDKIQACFTEYYQQLFDKEDTNNETQDETQDKYLSALFSHRFAMVKSHI